MPLEDIFIYLGNLQLKHIELQQCYYICRDPKTNTCNIVQNCVTAFSE